MKALTTLITLLMAVSLPAFADGFVCESLDSDLRVKIYNHTQSVNGTRNGAVMVLSDSSVQPGRKTIAVFRDSNGTLANLKGTRFIADVDLRFNEIPKGEYLLGTRLGAVKYMVLLIDFNHLDAVQEGDLTSGKLILEMRRGDRIETELDCTRYLKN